MNWIHLPMFQQSDEVYPVPEGWAIHQIESLYENLLPGKLFENKTVFEHGKIPVINQSAETVIGYHNEEPGVLASKSRPVATFANHTCEMRWMTHPYSVIQNVFSMVGVDGLCDTRFFYYLTKGRVHIEEYKGHYPDFRRLWVAVPPLPEQRAIASVLGALDDKIELNRRMNKTLEDMAAAIFKAWFVDFEPVHAKANGATSFPGMPQEVFDSLPSGFVDSELGKIPEGWKTGILGDVGLNIRNNIKPADIDTQTPYIGLEHMPRKSISLADWETVGKVTSGKSRFNKGQFLFGKLRPYFHKVGVAPMSGVCSTDILVIEPTEPKWSAFLIGHLSSEDFINHATACSSGTKMPRTNWKDMANYEVVLPPSQTALVMTKILSPSVDAIIENIFESQTLAETRDILLPKLLSGEVRVSDIIDNQEELDFEETMGK